MEVKLYEFTDRDEAHRKLEACIRGKYPHAECREDTNAEKPYQVWSAGEAKVVRDGQSDEQFVPSTDPVELDDAVLDRLAEKLIERLERRGG